MNVLNSIIENISKLEMENKNAKDEISRIDAEKMELVKKFRNGSRFTKAGSEEGETDINLLINKTEELSQLIYRNDIKIALFKENAIIEVVKIAEPAIRETLAKYNGKRAGEKTREKIRKEVNEKTGFSVYFDCGYAMTNNASYIDIYPRNTYLPNNIMIMFQDPETEKPMQILEDNVILSPSFNSQVEPVFVTARPHTDINADVDELLNKWSALKAAAEVYNSALAAFREIAPDGRKTPETAYVRERFL